MCSTHQPARRRNRRGNIIVLSACLLSLVMGFAAFSIDIGYLTLVKGQLQSAVDAATLAAAMELNPNADQADVEVAVKQSASDVAQLNRVGPYPGLLLDENTDIELGRRDWNPSTQSFSISFGPNATPYNIVRVTGRLGGSDTGSSVNGSLPLFFAPAVGQNNVDMNVTSVATFQPRDMMLVLDYSGSMNDDTEFKSIPSLGQSTVTGAITQMWNELGNPTYGSMPFTPQFITVGGVPASGTTPHIDVTWKGRQVTVQSTLPVISVRMTFANGNTQTFTPLPGEDTFSGTGGNASSLVRKVWVLSGTNHLESPEGLGEDFPFFNTDLINYLSLSDVTYPNPSGSWSDFVNYVNTSSHVNTAGFRYRFGTMCLINYWNEKYARASQSHNLWKCSTQPLHMTKNASDVLLDYIQEVEADDRCGLVIYTHNSSSGAIVESGLTSDLESLKPLYRQRQAGHYDSLTNIYAGIRQARLHIESNARPQAFRMIVLMTDGVANQPSGNPSQLALNEAQLCLNARIRIMTVSLGLGADTSLMQQIADLTGGVHFNVPGGATFSEYEAQLTAVFQQIAADRPLKLLPSGL